ncbi:DUF1405 domain-containing protein [Cohnella cholangitidis]|uniref:DUF1405 domain-containing protein n=1 Tax=Cohnella cholangitidis TaxID=2598458 RepID=A0A7G5C5B8_9BACL|nr:DUF1405 domain-containing protein [Cohnella cholangitidis]QMV44402.1 DUF1405 domain-containing protein [Cohnella cholangitidis]
MSWLKWLLSRSVLLHPTTLWLMMLIYIPGTIYGYYWYKGQLESTWENNPHWQIPFVPDSPTASLFFALAVLWLWISPGRSRRGWVNGVRGVVETLGVVTSVKYGIWATAVIFAGQAQGDVLQWDHWMLIIGHTAMAIVALLYARFFTFGGLALLAAAAWTFLNDTVDYTFGVYPYLPTQLDDDLFYVGLFTFILTALSVLSAAIAKFAFVTRDSN